MEFNARVISNGRITIPDVIREQLKLKKGDIVRVDGLKKMQPVAETEAS